MKYGRTADNRAVRPLAAVDGYGWAYGYDYGGADPGLPIIINGDGAYSGAPAKDEDPQYPMANLYSPARYRVWSTKVGTADGAIKVQIDLGGGANGAGAGGADKAVDSAGLLGLRGHAGSTPPANIVVGYRTRAQGYSATGYTTVATVAPAGERDSVVQFPVVSARYWEFNFTAYDAAGFALGAFWLGVLQDLGHYWSADGGGSWADFHNALVTPTAGGHQLVSLLGDPSAQYTLAFRALPSATRATLADHFGTRNRGRATLILDENSVPRQFLVKDGPSFSQRFTGLYDATLELVRLG
jgi:hypothetical protein